MFLLLFYFLVIAGSSTWKLYSLYMQFWVRITKQRNAKKLLFSAAGEEKQGKSVSTPLSPVQALFAVHFEAS